MVSTWLAAVRTRCVADSGVAVVNAVALFMADWPNCPGWSDCVGVGSCTRSQVFSHGQAFICPGCSPSTGLSEIPRARGRHSGHCLEPVRLCVVFLHGQNCSAVVTSPLPSAPLLPFHSHCSTYNSCFGRLHCIRRFQTEYRQ